MKSIQLHAAQGFCSETRVFIILHHPKSFSAWTSKLDRMLGKYSSQCNILEHFPCYKGSFITPFALQALLAVPVKQC